MSQSNGTSLHTDNLQTVILCGGKGTRLREETEIIPKPLVRIGEKPILWHIMKYYQSYGFQDFVLPIGYKGEKIREYFFHQQQLLTILSIDYRGERPVHEEHVEAVDKWRVTIVDTGVDTEGGGRVRQIAKYIIGDTFLLTYGDGVSDVNLDALVRFHRDHGKIVTVTGVYPPARFGAIGTEGNMVTDFKEKHDRQAELINGGYFVMNRDVFRYFQDDHLTNMERDVLPKLAKDRQLVVYRHGGYWQCMDALRDVELLQGVWESGDVPWRRW